MTAKSNEDPGYAATSKMLAQAALTLALTNQKPGEGGVLTPATALGKMYASRLRDAGVTFAVANDF